ncbi:MAG: DUF6476 family protein [Phyllobacteriaceae bacterium]|nr:DUF6476 family protein [Phyllobacteriaceae bacterium]
MNQLPLELAEEAPLDPAAERVRRKMVRLLAVSIGIMFIGVFAVLAAIVWQLGEATTPSLTAGDLIVPDGFSVLESDLAADAILLRGTVTDGSQRVLIFDRASGEMTGDFTIGSLAGAASDQ